MNISTVRNIPANAMQVFTNLDSIDQGFIGIRFKNADLDKSVRFDVPLDFFISSNSLAALCVACRPHGIASVRFDFEVSSDVKHMLARDYGINVESSVVDKGQPVYFGNVPNDGVPARSKTFLNFSGGVDSLAAYYLCGKSASLLSIEFGGNFSRESKFFRLWDTQIIKTNFRDKPFNESTDWRFMAAGAILMSDYWGIKNLLWGTVLEASPYWFNTTTKQHFEGAKPWQVFAVAGINIGQTVTSLSEFGTTKVAGQFGRGILQRSIESAAAQGSIKLFRKRVLEKLANNEEITEAWAQQHKPNDKSKVGKSFAEEILALYFGKKLGLDFVEKYIMETDEKFRAALNHIDMDYIEKYNPENLVTAPVEFRERFSNTFKKLGIEPYAESDYVAINAVRDYLSSRYKF